MHSPCNLVTLEVDVMSQITFSRSRVRF